MENKKNKYQASKKIIISWKNRKITDEGIQSNRVVGMAHPGCCSQDGGCPKKHG